MSESFDPYTLLFLALAVVIFLRLRSVLGRRTGNESQHYDPYSSGDVRNEPARADGQDNVIAMPRGQEPATNMKPTAEEIAEQVAKFAPKGSALSKTLMKIIKIDPSFELEHFVKGAKAAYEMIVMAFADGNRKSLKQLLSSEVYEGFSSALDEREKKSESVDSSFVGIGKADIIEAKLKDKLAQITVKFVSELITATQDKEGRIIDGDPNAVREVTDIWTFAREISERDPNWKLVATEAAN